MADVAPRRQRTLLESGRHRPRAATTTCGRRDATYLHTSFEITAGSGRKTTRNVHRPGCRCWLESVRGLSSVSGPMRMYPRRPLCHVDQTAIRRSVHPIVKGL